MKKIFLGFTLIFCFYACNNKSDTKESGFVNNLISPKSCITYEQDLIVPEEYFFFKSINVDSFLSSLTNNVLNGNTIVAYQPFSKTETYDKETLASFFTTINSKEYHTLLFDEEWALDTAKFIMKKKVNSYSIVRQFNRETTDGEFIPTKSVIASFNFEGKIQDVTTKGCTLLESNVAYEVPFTNEENPEFFDNIQIRYVARTILDKALCGNVQSYSFSYRDTLLLREQDEVNESLGEGIICYTNEDGTGNVDTLCVEQKADPQEITGLAFIEDWYLNKSTMEIVKIVKGIAPVRTYYHFIENSDPELVKSIPFVMYLNSSE